VHFARSWWGLFGRPTYRYRPSICIDVANLWDNLFCRPQYGHYYFGDYYDPGYARRGIYPWFERNKAHNWYSPFCAYGEWRHEREQPRWLEGVRRDFDDRRAYKELRPAHTYQALEAEIRRQPERDRGRMAFAKPLTSYSANPKEGFRFERVNADARRKIIVEGRERHDLAIQRARWESSVTKPGKEFQPSKVQFPRTATMHVVSPPGPSEQKSHREEGFTPGGPPTVKRDTDRETKSRWVPPTPPTPEAASQQKSHGDAGLAPGGPATVKRDSDRETKSRGVPPAPSTPEAASQQKSHGDAGSAPGGAPSGKHSSDKETKTRRQPPAPSDETSDKNKDDSKSKRRDGSNN